MITSDPASEQSQAAPTSPPVSLSARIDALDVLRGIAVLAALFVAIWVFGGFSGQQQKQLLLDSKGWNYRVYGAMELLLNGKMRAVIALVFGAAMVLFLTKQAETGTKPAADIFIKRQLWLILFGLINGVLLLWTNDLLFHLGVMGLLLFSFFRLNPRHLLIAGLLTTAIYCGKSYWNFSDEKKAYSKYLAVTALEKKFEKDSIAKMQKGVAAKKDTLTKQQNMDKQAWIGLLASKKPDIKKDDPNAKAMRSGSYAKVWNHMIAGVQSREYNWTYRIGIWDLASMIFFGMLLYKIGFFSNRFSRGRYLLFGLAALAGGLLLGWFRLHYTQIGLQDYEKFIKRFQIPADLFFAIERAAVALGYASLLMFFISVRLLAPVWRAFAATGKMALTNYLVQTIICTIVFYGYGMGYFGRLTQFQLYFFAAEIVLVQVIFSVLWLRLFNYGPAEWLLRRVSAGKWLPQRFRKPSANLPAPVFS